MAKIIRTMLVLLATGATLATASAQEISGDDMRSLDGQVQEIKADVLGIASDLSNLEERLLYPSGTQVALFVSIADDDEFRLDAVKIETPEVLACADRKIRFGTFLQPLPDNRGIGRSVLQSVWDQPAKRMLARRLAISSSTGTTTFRDPPDRQ